MTIKPVVVAGTQKRVTGTETEKIESHTHGAHNGQLAVEQPNARSAIDNHGQSPQRRNESFDDIARHRRSPHKNGRTKRRDHLDHHKRDRGERIEKHSTASSAVSNKSNTSLGISVTNTSVNNSTVTDNNNVTNVGVPGKTQENLPNVLGCQSPTSTQNAIKQSTTNIRKSLEDHYSGYNSGDEHYKPKEEAVTAGEWHQRDEQFAKCMSDRGYILKSVEEDGACLFRAISLQIYGDEEMHDVIRQHTMDYIYKNREYFCHFVTEDINSYIKRKRQRDSHGNHIEIQAMSEIYSRPVEVYCYKSTPINIFNSEQLNNGFAPLRLSYQRGSHYNAILDPYNATVGVGLGLSGYKPELQTKEAVRLSEQLQIEQTMFEDKLKTTDWEATNEVIEEQIARESYLQWCRENLQKTRAVATSTTASTSSATVTSIAEVNSEVQVTASKSSTVINLNNESKASGTTLSSANENDETVNDAAVDNNKPQCSSSAFATYRKKDDDGYDSDDTDMSSSASSAGALNSNGINIGIGESSLSSQQKRCKKVKSGSLNSIIRDTKKRRRDSKSASIVSPSNEADEAAKDTIYEEDDKNNQSDDRASSDIEQQPCTSKQLLTPEKSDMSSTANVAPSSVTETSSSCKDTLSTFYQELLRSSYANDGYAQLSESEMLQRAIQQSTQDYIDAQKQKYFYSP